MLKIVYSYATKSFKDASPELFKTVTVSAHEIDPDVNPM
jgi:hypothetical protein